MYFCFPGLFHPVFLIPRLISSCIFVSQIDFNLYVCFPGRFHPVFLFPRSISSCIFVSQVDFFLYSLFHRLISSCTFVSQVDFILYFSVSQVDFILYFRFPGSFHVVRGCHHFSHTHLYNAHSVAAPPYLRDLICVRQVHVSSVYRSNNLHHGKLRKYTATSS